MSGMENPAIIFHKADSTPEIKQRDEKVVVLHIEVCQKCESSLPASDIEDALEKYFSIQNEFTLNTLLFDTVLPDHLNYVRISSNSCIYKVNFLRETVVKHYHIYQNNEVTPLLDTIYMGSKSYSASFNWTLPNSAFEGLWESLIVENGLKEDLLAYVETGLLYSSKKVNPQFVLWNGIVLLHGPPGTGKTSLCKALAQKLSIRLNSRFASGQLIEVNSHNLFSKWYSESAKIVSNFFDDIKSRLSLRNIFFCILIDEVESLTQVRNLNKNDPADSVKVVNTVLTQIDQLQHYPNILIMATSNMTEIIDLAFADRADLKLHMQYPSRNGIYEIFRTSLEELISCGLIKGNKNDFFEGFIFESMKSRITDEGNNTINEILENSKALFNVSLIPVQMSGRTLRKIPFLTSAKFMERETPSVLEFIEAMKDVLRAHLLNDEKWFKI